VVRSSGEHILDNDKASPNTGMRGGAIDLQNPSPPTDGLSVSNSSSSSSSSSK